MKINKKMILGISISVVLALSIFATVYVVVIRNKKVDHSTIIIWGDRDFRAYKFPGKGTIEDPYIIENYNIDTSSARGIYITSTTKHFVIQNCVIKAANTAIFVSNTAEGTVRIINNDCSDNGFNGIYVVDSPSILIKDNTCNNNNREHGISVIESPNSIISGNTCNNQTGADVHDKNVGTGIYISNCENSTVTENICEDNYRHGISIQNSINSKIEGNELSENRRSGILVDNSRDSVISSNLFYDNTFVFEDLFYWSVTGQLITKIRDLTVEYYLSFTVFDNYVNDEPLGFYKNLSNEVFNGNNDGQSIFVNCFNLSVINTISENSLGMSFYFCQNSLISNNTFSNEPLTGISLYHSNKNTISSNTCNFNALGIWLYNSNESTIINNTCIQNYDTGIATFDSWDLNINDNYCSESIFNHGIHVGRSKNIELKRNICLNNNEGGIGTWNLTNVLIYNNTMIGNGHGMYLNGIKSFNISYNIISNSIEHGIIFSSKIYIESINNLIHNNLIADNIRYGVFLASYSNNTVIYHNSFRDNNLAGISQGFDSAFNNTWYNSFLMEGNWWSDWVAGTYAIDGTAGSFDLYPLVTDPWP